MALLTMEKFYYDYLKVDDTTKLSDNEKTYFEKVKSVAEKFFLNQIDRSLESADYNETYSGLGLGSLVLKNYPVTNIISIGEHDTSNIQIVGDLGLIQDYEEDFEVGRLNISIEYTAGYSSIPDDIQEAIGLLGVALHYEHDRGDHRLNIFTQTKRDNEIEFNKDVVPIITQEVINKYKDTRPVKIDYVSN